MTETPTVPPDENPENRDVGEPTETDERVYEAPESDTEGEPNGEDAPSE